MDYLKIYNTLDSTNKEAQRLLAAGPVDSGMTILAREQTAGRGQYGRQWVAAQDEHLAMTLIYKPVHMTTADLPMIGMKVSLGIIRALHSMHSDLPLSIKWPNDIYLNQNKLCGILIENALAGSTVQHSVIGIGLNANESGFPTDLPQATSLTMATGQPYSIENLARQLRQSVLHLLDETGMAWKKEYHKLLFGLGEIHQFTIKQGNINARVLGVTDTGKLSLELPNREQQSYASHEIKWVIPKS